jgi:hypothetical protein
MRNLLLSAACIAVLCVILALGLWPFHAPRNEVTWLPDRNGLSFCDYGTVMSAGTFQPSGSPDESSCSIEIWLMPAHSDDGGAILAFYAQKQLRLSLHQSLSDLMLQRGKLGAGRTYIDNLFRRAQSVFLTVTSGTQATAIYVNGTLAKTVQLSRLTASDCAGRLILGDSPLQPDTWPGQVRGLAIYYSELSPSTVLRHYHEWTANRRPETIQNEHNVALYLFNERAGSLVHNHAETRPDLAIPATYTVLDKISLEPFWEEFNLSGGYWKGILKNVVGFIPLGLCFYAYFSLVRRYQRAGLITVALGFVVSITIEVLQAYLPTRDSGTTDLITNTLGTWIGVRLYRAASPIGAEKLPWLMSDEPVLPNRSVDSRVP